jgi:hypothetical protein
MNKDISVFNRILTVVALIILSFFSPYLVAVILTIILVAWLRNSTLEEVVQPNTDMSIKKECIGVFNRFIKASINKRQDVLKEICRGEFVLKKIPVKILQTELVSCSSEKVEMNFLSISAHGEILANKFTFKQQQNKLLIEEINEIVC